MPDDSSRDKIIQNLKDCDCDEKIIHDFLSALDCDEKKRALRLLATHRQELLDRLHKNKNCIDCLDYLVYQMEKENRDK